MMQLRSSLFQCLMGVLVAMVVMASVDMGAAKAATANAPAHMTGHADQLAHPCPTMDETGTSAPDGHAACSMTVCCFSDIPAFGAPQPQPKLVRTNHELAVEPRLTQAEPERAKKPPKPYLIA